jgi:hypothetical protein
MKLTMSQGKILFFFPLNPSFSLSKNSSFFPEMKVSERAGDHHLGEAKSIKGGGSVLPAVPYSVLALFTMDGLHESHC